MKLNNIAIGLAFLLAVSACRSVPRNRNVQENDLTVDDLIENVLLPQPDDDIDFSGFSDDDLQSEHDQLVRDLDELLPVWKYIQETGGDASDIEEQCGKALQRLIRVDIEIIQRGIEPVKQSLDSLQQSVKALDTLILKLPNLDSLEQQIYKLDALEYNQF